MTTASAAELRQKIRGMWPEVALLWLPDGLYECQKLDTVLAVLERSGVSTLIRRGEAFDCDDYALLANAWVKRHVYDSGSARPWAFGECFGTQFKGREMDHSVNILVADDGQIWLMYAEGGWKHWRAERNEDTVHTVKM